ncbi:hypothetical protein RBA41_22650 [Massilia sp. CCM 9210]|uniref:hypothetical protein n=1 Tax=Massilia scottii TaxID=3057166 RepID=UPI00279669F4|nr:hypothetical protein [Massilia sp. CCM 9210]MDQ1816101.1 hypothetical protein [Massilia sp. CCM 9210]
MHSAQKYVNQHLKPTLSQNISIKHLVLTADQATKLRFALVEDESDYIFSACISIADALQALERSIFTWATVKLYYAMFYLTRALLASYGIAIIYESTKAFIIPCQPGSVPVKRDGTTHKVVLETFTKLYPNSPISSQLIGAVAASDWLMARREEANYKNSRFSEPDPPPHFRSIVEIGVRRSLAAYLKDETYLYAFSEAHAMLALPVEALKLAVKRLHTTRTGQIFCDQDSRYLSSLFFDKAGPFPEMAKMFAGKL